MFNDLLNEVADWGTVVVQGTAAIASQTMRSSARIIGGTTDSILDIFTLGRR